MKTFNLPLPTLGGKQLWSDLFFHVGWRIQRHCYTGTHRLLDPADIRRAWGTYEDCLAACPTDLRPDSPQLIILLHGLSRSKDSLGTLARQLTQEGYSVAALNYPSLTQSIQQHAEQLAQLLGNLQGIQQVSFVTHSLGGLVVRQLLADSSAPWRRRISVDRVLMLFPPNQGSHLADLLHQNPLFHLALGPSGQQLTTRGARQIPPLADRFAVIAGDIGNGTDDGTVKIRETWLPGAEDWLLLPAGHTFGMAKGSVIQAVKRYLATGSLRPSAALSSPGRRARMQPLRRDRA